MGFIHKSSVIKYPPQFRCQHLSLSLSYDHSWVFVHACVYACVWCVGLKSRNFCLFTCISIQKSLLTRSVRLCISLFVWLRWCFLSARQCSGRVSGDGARANIVKTLWGDCQDINPIGLAGPCHFPSLFADGVQIPKLSWPEYIPAHHTHVSGHFPETFLSCCQTVC